MIGRSRSTIGVAALLLLAMGCGADWHRIRPPEPASYPPRQQAQIWRAGEAIQVHGLRLTSDSVSAVPYLQPVACDSCRVAFARAEIDSIRLGDPSGGFWGSMGLVLLGLLATAFVLCATGSPCDVGN